MPRFIDISMALENGVPSDPPGYEFDIRYISHAESLLRDCRRRGDERVGEVRNEA